MEVYVNKQINKCSDCPCKYFDEWKGVVCCLNNALDIQDDFYNNIHPSCPLKQLPTDNKWDKLKEWANKMKQGITNANGCDDLIWCEELYDALLDKMQELEKGANL